MSAGAHSSAPYYFVPSPSQWPLVGSVAIAMLYAGLNFVAKWTSCDAIGGEKSTTSGGPTGGQRVHDVLFNGPALPAPEAAPAAAVEDDETNILRFIDRVRHTNGKFEKDAAAEPVRPAAVRLRLASKRIQTRAWRQRKAA